jgi:hypothetical protein
MGTIAIAAVFIEKGQRAYWTVVQRHVLYNEVKKNGCKVINVKNDWE